MPLQPGMAMKDRGSCPGRRGRVHKPLAGDVVGGAMDGLIFGQALDVGMHVHVLSTSSFLGAEAKDVEEDDVHDVRPFVPRDH